MATLHTVNKSPFNSAAFSTCIGLAKSGSTVLLFEDGVYAAWGLPGVKNDTARDRLLTS